MTFIILHGTLGTPEINWFPWVANELERIGHQTVRPQLPTPKGQTLQNWVTTVDKTVKKLRLNNTEIIFVAHSMSPLGVCHYLTTLHQPVRACFFVAPFAKRLPDTEEPYSSLNNPFIDAPINWSKVRQNCKHFVCFASDNDPYVPLSITEDFAKHVSAKYIIVPSAGHFNTDSGYTQFPLLDRKSVV